MVVVVVQPGLLQRPLLVVAVVVVCCKPVLTERPPQVLVGFQGRRLPPLVVVELLQPLPPLSRLARNTVGLAELVVPTFQPIASVAVRLWAVVVAAMELGPLSRLLWLLLPLVEATFWPVAVVAPVAFLVRPLP